jgi:hypothetical protein
VGGWVGGWVGGGQFCGQVGEASWRMQGTVRREGVGKLRGHVAVSRLPSGRLLLLLLRFLPAMLMA